MRYTYKDERIWEPSRQAVERGHSGLFYHGGALDKKEIDCRNRRLYLGMNFVSRSPCVLWSAYGTLGSHVPSDAVAQLEWGAGS